MFENRNPYNVPTSQIRPPQNQVNIGGNQSNPADAFAAFSRFYAPMVQNNADMITGANARPIDAQGAPIPGAPQQYGPEDITNALMSMFQRQEDAGTLSKYGGFSSQAQRWY